MVSSPLLLTSYPSLPHSALTLESRKLGAEKLACRPMSQPVAGPKNMYVLNIALLAETPWRCVLAQPSSEVVWSGLAAKLEGKE